MKVLYICGEPSPYRIDFFGVLGLGCELTAVFEKRADESEKRDPRWYRKNYKNCRCIFLDEQGAPPVGEIIAAGAFDIIVVCNFYTAVGMRAIRYLRSHKMRYGIEIDGGLPRPKAIFKDAVKKYLLGGADFFLSPGRLPDAYLRQYGAAADKIYRYGFTSLFADEIVSSPPSASQKDELRTKLGLRGKKTVIAVGQFVYRKGFDVLLRACRDIGGDTAVYIIGGTETEEYKTLCRDLSLKNVYFLGFKCREELVEYYRAADIFVLPTREDIWGLVVNEAMANALPVITTERCVAGCELVIEGENGFLVKPDDAEALADKINILLNDNELRNKMSFAAFETINDFTIEKMAERHAEIFAAEADPARKESE